MSSFQQFLSVKTVIVNEIIQKLTEQGLMTEELSAFFEIQISDVVEVGKKEKVKLRKEKSAAKEKRPPTPHQLRVSKCLSILKERYAHVAHRYRMGAAQFMAAYLRDNENIEGDNHENDAVLNAVEKMNEKHGNVFTEQDQDSSSSSSSLKIDAVAAKEAKNKAKEEAKALKEEAKALKEEAKALKEEAKTSKKKKTTIIVQEEEPVEEQSDDDQ
jgi:hypothetical protein